MKSGIQNVLRLSPRLWPVFVVSLALCAAQAARAEVITLWNFQDMVSASVVADNMSAGDVSISSGTIGYQNGTDDSGTRIGNASSWSQTDFLPSGKYIEFSVTPANGYELHITNVTIRLGRTSTGPTSFSAQYSLDGFATAGTDAGSGAIDSTDTDSLDSMSLLAPSNVQAGSLTYRVWGYNASSTGNMRFNNFRLYGNVNSQLPIPVISEATATNVTGFTASWSEVVDATGYELDVSTNATFSAPGNVIIETDFDVGYPPAGWTEGATDQSDTYAHSGAYSAKLGAADDYLITPMITSASTVVFWSYTTSADPDIVLEYASDTNGSWTTLDESPFSGDTEQWNERTVDVGGFSGIYVRFKKNGTGSLYIDDVSVSGPSVADCVTGYQARMIAGVGNTSASVTGVVSNTEYFYRVRATNSTSISANSTTQSVTTLSMPAPTSLAASNVGGDRFEANWNAVSEADGYFLDVSTNDTFSDFQAGYENRDVGDVTMHTVTGLVVETDYYYRVRAYDTGSASDNSMTQLVRTVLKTNPSNHASGFAAAETTHRTIVLEWTDSVGGELPDGYVVRGSTNGFDDIVIPEDGSSVGNLSTWNPRYAHRIEYREEQDEVSGQDSEGLLPGHTYYFKLFPMTNSGDDSLYKTNGSVPQVSVTTVTDVPFEDFESGVGLGGKTAYETGDVTLKSGIWELSEVLLVASDNDRKRDQRALRMRNHGVATMKFDATNVETVMIDHANYTGDSGGKFIVERSIDGGFTWQQVGDEVTCGDTVATASFTVHWLDGVRLRICKRAVADDENRINIDNVRFTPYRHDGSVFYFR